ncbi:MAG TPA: hypothetical protein VN745_01495 [Verrucomicrobiae bacterium]|nr:hypothetical protein [Verrucomicrobiae bacterium]
MLTRPRIRNILGEGKLWPSSPRLLQSAAWPWYSVLVMELTPQQLGFLGQLRSRGFDIVGFPMYEQYIGVRKGNCGALLAPVNGSGFTLYGEPSYLVAGSLSARTIQSDGHWFVRKKDKVAATPERTAELESFTAELADALLPVV